MAVTLVSSPPTTPSLWSCSYDGIIKLTSDKYGTANVTQFRYVITVTGLAAVATKYTVPDGSSGSTAYINIKDLFQTLFQLSPY